jgi:hypothetical protein
MSVSSQPAPISTDIVEQTIVAFTRLDERGDRKAMNKLAQRLQREQPFLLQYAATPRAEHGDAVGEASVFYATLVWSMFDRSLGGTLPRITAENLAAAEQVVDAALAKEAGLAERAPYDRTSPALAAGQPQHLRQAPRAARGGRARGRHDRRDLRRHHRAPDPGRGRGVRRRARRHGARAYAQGTVAGNVARRSAATTSVPCGSGKKYKKCHGAE